MTLHFGQSERTSTKSAEALAKADTRFLHQFH